MSIFSGIYSLKQGPDGFSPPTRCAESIKGSISRRADVVETWSGSRFYLARIDVGAFKEAGICGTDSEKANRSVAAIAGHPFLTPSRETGTSRQTQLCRISSELDQNNTKVLGECHGTFALCHYRLPDGRLLLSTDRLGSRPVYYHVSKDFLYFSTTLRVLEALIEVPKRMDIQGMAEQITIGYPLGDRTPYADIKILECGQYLVCENSSVRLYTYFDWDQISPTAMNTEELLDRAYEVFHSAVAIRSKGQSSVVCTLSGGLDSRCIATVLHDLSKEVYTLTWATGGYLDGMLASEYAKTLGLKQLVRFVPAWPTWQDYINCLQDLAWPGMPEGFQSRLVFSGDGGSVGVGLDYVTEERINWMRAGQKDRIINFLVKKHLLPWNFLQHPVRQEMQDALVDGINTEFNHIHSHDGGSDLWIYYLKNDQRRHLHVFWENIDVSRIEYLLPFYDSQFMELLVSGPVEIFLKHNFYHQWLDRFPPVIKSVAWQTYPGHLPCPVPLTVAGRVQWDKNPGDIYRGKNNEAFRRCAQAVFQKGFPSQFFSRSRLIAALILHGLRLRPYGWVFAPYTELHDILSKCSRVVAPYKGH